MDLDRSFVNECLAHAYAMAEFSPDPSNQNGAVIYSGRFVASCGFNHFYPGIPPEIDDRAKKYERIVHAEADACHQLVRKGDHPAMLVRIFDFVMFCPWAICKPCAITFLGVGLRTLVIHKQRAEIYYETREKQPGENKRNWSPDVGEAFDWLRNAGVKIIEFDGPVTAYKGPGILCNGRLWHPSTFKLS